MCRIPMSYVQPTVHVIVLQIDTQVEVEIIVV